MNEFSIYQLKRDDAYHYERFMSFEYNENKGLSVKDYDCVYTGTLDETSSGVIENQLEEIFSKFNAQIPADFKGHSLSVSDVITIGKEAYYVDDMGFVPMPNFIDDFFIESAKAIEERAKAAKESTIAVETPKLKLSVDRQGEEIKTTGREFYRIYQHNKEVSANYHFNPEDLTNSTLPQKGYDYVYVGKMTDLFKDEEALRTSIFYKPHRYEKMTDKERLDYIVNLFNSNPPDDFEGRPLAVGDIIELDVDSWYRHPSSIYFDPSEKVYCVDNNGFTLLPDFYLEEKKRWCEVYDLNSWKGKLHICDLYEDENKPIKFSNGYTMKLCGGYRWDASMRSEIYDEKGDLMKKVKDYSSYSGRVGDVVLENGERYIAWVVPELPAHILAEQEARHDAELKATLAKFKKAEREAERRQGEPQRQNPTVKKPKRDIGR